VISRGAVRLGGGPKDPSRFAAMADSALFPRGSLRVLQAEESTDLLGEPVDGPALQLQDALAVAPERLIRRWVEPHARRSQVAAVRRAADAWELLGHAGEVLGRADVLCLATGHRLPRLEPGLPLEPVRGQATWSAPLADAPMAASWGGYSAPTADGGVIFGATHDHGSEDETVTAADDERNLLALAARRPVLAEAVRKGTLHGRASIRATTRDRLPVAGLLASGAWVLSGLGGRGFTTAPLLAEHVAAAALGAPSPLPRSLAVLVDPARLPRRPSEA
jgi:tRNA 5-methylaminomethyl-2-thiouridine biosynthesis bifunctional protein